MISRNFPQEKCLSFDLQSGVDFVNAVSTFHHPPDLISKLVLNRSNPMYLANLVNLATLTWKRVLQGPYVSPSSTDF